VISTIDYNEYVGRIGVGRVERGTLRKGQMGARQSGTGNAAGAGARYDAV
jgi:GTP-binding protein